MKCDKCGWDDKGTGSAHVCELSGRLVQPKNQIEQILMDKITKLQDLLSESKLYLISYRHYTGDHRIANEIGSLIDKIDEELED